MKTILAAIWPDWIYQQHLSSYPNADTKTCWLLSSWSGTWNIWTSSIFIFTHYRNDERISRISSTNYRNSLTKAAWVWQKFFFSLTLTNWIQYVNKLSLTVSDYRRLSSFRTQPLQFPEFWLVGKSAIMDFCKGGRDRKMVSATSHLK